MVNAINWFEIPATDFNRAKKFYTDILGAEMEVVEMMGIKMAFFNTGDRQSVGGAVCSGEGYSPSDKGVKVYLNGGDDLNVPLSKVEKAGGKLIMPKTHISDDIGYMAFFIDSEGNFVAFHSQN